MTGTDCLDFQTTGLLGCDWYTVVRDVLGKHVPSIEAPPCNLDDLLKNILLPPTVPHHRSCLGLVPWWVRPFLEHKLHKLDLGRWYKCLNRVDYCCLTDARRKVKNPRKSGDCL